MNKDDSYIIVQSTMEEFKQYYLYVNELSSPEAEYAVYSAFPDFDEDWANDDIVIIKELDRKRAEIYNTLSTMWNPYRSNIYAVYDLGEKYVAVCEYIEGKTLQKYILSKGEKDFPNIDIRTAINICIQLCEALSDIHKAGFVHKDLSPNNIMSDDDFKTIKLIDFGIATKVSEKAGGDTEILGTKGFAAPEVIGITKTDGRADIYSIGCILNFIITKKAPREGVIVEEPHLQKIIQKATAEDRRDRYQNVFELKKALMQAKKKNLDYRFRVLQYIPGFRSQNIGKSFVAVLTYIYLIRAFILSIWNHNLTDSIQYNLFSVVIPLAVIFDFNNLFRFLPHKIKVNQGYIMLIKIIMVVISLLIFGYLITIKG